jgi:hypothetical protein
MVRCVRWVGWVRCVLGVVFGIGAAGLVACAPQTDRARYATGEAGTSTFTNQLAIPLYLGGCGHFEYEKRVGDAWVSQGPDVVCVWQGFAQRVAPSIAVTDGFVAREPGIWRLRYEVGAGCSESAPLDAQHCARVDTIVSNEFQVIVNDCVVTGCSSEICSDHPQASPCIWRAEYECYRDAHCGHFGPADECAWEPTEELGACLARTSDPSATPAAP